MSPSSLKPSQKPNATKLLKSKCPLKVGWPWGRRFLCLCSTILRCRRNYRDLFVLLMMWVLCVITDLTWRSSRFILFLLMLLHGLLSHLMLTDGACAWWGALAWDLLPPAVSVPKLQAQCLLTLQRSRIENYPLAWWLGIQNGVIFRNDKKLHISWHSLRSVSAFVESLEAPRLSSISSLNLLLKDVEILAVSTSCDRWEARQII